MSRAPMRRPWPPEGDEGRKAGDHYLPSAKPPAQTWLLYPRSVWPRSPRSVPSIAQPSYGISLSGPRASGRRPSTCPIVEPLLQG